MAGELRTVIFCSHGVCACVCVCVRRVVLYSKMMDGLNIYLIFFIEMWFYFVFFRLKMTNEEIRHAILSMDEQEDLPKDMLEQVTHTGSEFAEL